MREKKPQYLQLQRQSIIMQTHTLIISYPKMGKGYIQKDNFLSKSEALFIVGVFFCFQGCSLEVPGLWTVKESLSFLSLSAFAFHSWEKNLRALNKFKYES